MPPRRTKTRKPRTYTRPKRTIRRTKRPAGTFRKSATRVRRGAFRAGVTGDPFPPRKFYKLHYTSSALLTTGTAGVIGSTQVYRLNSLYDPDLTNAGNQPYAYDTCSAIYARYKVFGVMLNMEFWDPSADGLVVCAKINNPTDSFSMAGYGWPAVTEKPFAVTRTLVNSGSQKTFIRQFLPMYIPFNVSKLQYNTDLDNTTAAISGNPASVVTLELGVASDRGAAGATVLFRVTMMWTAMFYDRVTLAQS